MNWRTQIQQQLETIRQGGAGGQLSVPIEGGAIEASCATVDRVGCAFHQITVRTDRLADASMERLHACSDDIAREVRYLLEPIQVLEVDDDALVIQLRSVPPAVDESGTSYYEVSVARGGVVELKRFAKQPGQPRQPVISEVTRAVFERLAVDMAEAALQSSAANP